MYILWIISVSFYLGKAKWSFSVVIFFGLNRLDHNIKWTSQSQHLRKKISPPYNWKNVVIILSRKKAHKIYLSKGFQRTIDKIIARQLACILRGHQHHFDVFLVFHRQFIPNRIEHRCIQRLNAFESNGCRVTIREGNNQGN